MLRKVRYRQFIRPCLNFYCSMQRHLRCHGLPGEEVERLAGNILAITRHLRMARRTIYHHHHSGGGQVGAGPQTFVDGAPVPGYASYDCLGMCGPGWQIWIRFHC
jgi:hypothetical protein